MLFDLFTKLAEYSPRRTTLKRDVSTYFTDFRRYNGSGKPFNASSRNQHQTSEMKEKTLKKDNLNDVL